MLNDLFAIERGLTAHGIELADRHPDIKDMARGLAFRVRLHADGRISSVEIVPDTGRGTLWTLRDGQHNGFPGLKTGSGLLCLDDQARDTHALAWDRDKAPTSRRSELLRLLGDSPVDTAQVSGWPNAGHRKRIRERLEMLRALGDDPPTAAVPAAFERFVAALNASPTFLESLMAALAEMVRNRGSEWLEPVRAALIGPVALAIDVAEDDFERDAGDPRQIGPVSTALSDLSSSEGGQTEPEAFCALSGRAAKLHAGNFPQPNLPGVGQTYIFSRNRDIPALTRYRRTADASFPIGSQLVRRLSGAITALTGEGAKGSTWRLIPGETGEKPDLLVVSLPPPLQEGAADTVTDDEEEGDAEGVQGTTRLFELASRVLKHSKGKAGHGRAAEMVVLVLRTVDPANRKAVYHRPVDADELYRAAKNWLAATANAPREIRHHIWIKNGSKSKLVLSRPPRVSPLSITALSKMQFVDGGKRRISLRGITFAHAFGLFLREGDVARRAQRTLNVLLRRQAVLLCAVSQIARRGRDKQGRPYLETFDPKNDLRRDALRTAAWLGALLHYLNRHKEIYMSDVGFRLGQLLAAADVIHVGYCADMRGGDIPMTLIGNSVFSIAGTNPERALSIIQGRWKPYDAWAKPRPRLSDKIDKIFERSKPLRELGKKLKSEGKDDDAARSAKQAAQIEAPGWAMRNALAQAVRLRRLAPEMAADLKHVQASDTFRAELLLGYMAGLPNTTEHVENPPDLGNSETDEGAEK